MSLSLEDLEKRKKELQDGKDQAELTYHRIIGALALIEELIKSEKKEDNVG